MLNFAVPMENIIHDIQSLFQATTGREAVEIRKIPQSGSDRTYFRIDCGDDSFIATHGTNLRENAAFIYFAEHFREKGCPVPAIIASSPDKTIYIQEDLGDVSLLATLDELGHVPEVYALFEQALAALARMQVAGDQGLDYSRCITSREFGRKAIVSDLLYFRYYFLDTLKVPYDKEILLEEFEALGDMLASGDHRHFMFRDFQSRNVMVKDGKVHFIDFQGGMKGALQYDAASLLWQARAELPVAWKNDLFEYYITCVERELGASVDQERFTGQYHGYVLIRLLQVLGAYGFRGLFERKAHFLVSLPLALRNLRSFLEQHGLSITLPEFARLLKIVTSDEIIERFTPLQADDNTPLIVRIHSFSYRKGIPPDISGNGGGFVFDCRGLLNPGRFDEYKILTGRDKPVQQFFEQRSRMADFLNSIYTIVDISVEEYIRKGFRDLQVSFGCTGGQHRSVFAADSLARHLKNKFNVKIELSHIEQESKNWINT